MAQQCMRAASLALALSHTTPVAAPLSAAVDETLRLLKAFQFTDTHGEVRRGGVHVVGRGRTPHPGGEAALSSMQ